MPTTASNTFRYGPHEFQDGELHLPDASRPTGSPIPVVCLLHGGFWRMPHGREQMAAIAADLATRGYAAWNIGYRRVGGPGGGWPGTPGDVALAVDHLATLAEDGFDLDLERVVVVGHSAGGQLALCVSARGAGARFRPSSVRPVAAAALAAVGDLARAHALSVGNGAVAAFLGGTPDEMPDRYAAASPKALLPLGVRQLVVHGGRDEALPVDLSREYASAARASGDEVDFVELPAAGHMDFLDPHGAAHAVLCAWLADALRLPSRILPTPPR